MSWSNVLLIFRREVRDQLRDRRTIFMIFLLPVILYPSLGMGLLKLTEAFEDRPRTVVIIGADSLPESPPFPPLLNADQTGFHPDLFDSPREAAQLHVLRVPADSPWASAEVRRERLRDHVADVAVLVPPDIKERLESLRSDAIPIAYYSAGDKSQNTYLRVDRLLSRWSKAIGDERLAKEEKPADFAEPVKTEAQDVAKVEESGATTWARLFPFLLVIMALTGAFYPAIDLCAGEKERGTMETLLISPATRTEIVLGKFFTVMLASILSALLNIVSMGLTGYKFAGVLNVSRSAARAAAPMIQPPSLGSAFWMILLLIPLSAFFSALCVSLAVLARSMKEGQYYITPLYLTALPLIFITLVPGTELNLFYSLVPITGVALLLRSLMLGEYAIALRYFLPVLLPTIFYGFLALRWAVDQFNRESVLFREAERFNLRYWLLHLWRDRGPRPTAGEALVCFVAMLVAAWFAAQFLPTTPTGIVLGQLIYVALPTIGLSVLLTSDPLGTLRIRPPAPKYLAVAVALVLALNPLQMELRLWVEALFPISGVLQDALKGMMAGFPDLTTAVLVLALMPAICEELAFRGFILSGMESEHRTRSAIWISALLFGFLHVLISLFNQIFNATLIGLVLGLIAVRSRSLLPGVVFHFLNNAMAIVLATFAANEANRWLATWIYRDIDRVIYHYHWLALGAVVSALLLAWLVRDRPGAGTKPADISLEPLG